MRRLTILAAICACACLAAGPASRPATTRPTLVGETLVLSFNKKLINNKFDGAIFNLKRMRAIAEGPTREGVRSGPAGKQLTAYSVRLTYEWQYAEYKFRVDEDGRIQYFAFQVRDWPLPPNAPGQAAKDSALESGNRWFLVKARLGTSNSENPMETTEIHLERVQAKTPADAERLEKESIEKRLAERYAGKSRPAKPAYDGIEAHEWFEQDLKPAQAERPN